MPPEILLLSRLPTPIGEMLIVTDRAERLRALDWADHEPRLHRLLRRRLGGAPSLVPAPVPSRINAALASYFSGVLDAIDALAVCASGTAFQEAVWAALRAIPAGTTVSYGGLAARLGRSAAVRAVGLANGANPVGVVVPCHRVIGSDGSLTGYGGGLERKRWLLAHERA